MLQKVFYSHSMAERYTPEKDSDFHTRDISAPPSISHINLKIRHASHTIWKLFSKMSELSVNIMCFYL